MKIGHHYRTPLPVFYFKDTTFEVFERHDSRDSFGRAKMQYFFVVDKMVPTVEQMLLIRKRVLSTHLSDIVYKVLSPDFIGWLAMDVVMDKMVDSTKVYRQFNKEIPLLEEVSEEMFVSVSTEVL